MRKRVLALSGASALLAGSVGLMTFGGLAGATYTVSQPSVSSLLSIVASAGHVNHMTLTTTVNKMGATVAQITDGGDNFTVSGMTIPCTTQTNDDGHTLICSLTGITAVSVDLGDQDDFLDASG